MKNLLGILGGMGPLASAEFLRTIYEFNIVKPEQKAPACILYSEPRFPDRTEAILMGSDVMLIKHLIEAFEKFESLGVSKIVIACITIHYFLPKIPLHMQEKVINLIDVTIEEVLNIKEKHLLLCTHGTIQAKIFQTNKKWNFFKDYILFPIEDEQNKIHNLIYKIKEENTKEALIVYENYLETLSNKYKINNFIAACTEFHIVNKYMMNSDNFNKKYSIIDPLLLIAKNIDKLI